VNIGDIKPLEAGMTLFLRLAWDIKRYGPDVQRAFLRDFYAEQFGAEYADAIARLKDEYFRLCAIRRPEHMGFNRVYPNTPVHPLTPHTRFWPRCRSMAGSLSSSASSKVKTMRTT
jgi:hypothetical protein